MSAQPLSMLLVGNSYTGCNSLGRMLEQLAQSRGHILFTYSISPGGMTLEFHSTNPLVWTTLRQRRWDVISLQDHSLRPIEAPAKTLEFGATLAGQIKETHPAATRKLVYLTWPRQSTQEKIADLGRTYRQLAATIGADVVPCGPAWVETVQRLPAVALYLEDGSHPTAVATYLNALVFFGRLYNESPIGLPADLTYRGDNTANPENQDGEHQLPLEPAVAKQLQTIAWEVVRAEQALRK